MTPYVSDGYLRAKIRMHLRACEQACQELRDALAAPARLILIPPPPPEIDRAALHARIIARLESGVDEIFLERSRLHPARLRHWRRWRARIYRRLVRRNPPVAMPGAESISA